MFAILYFGVMIDAGLFDPIVRVASTYLLLGLVKVKTRRSPEFHAKMAPGDFAHHSCSWAGDNGDPIDSPCTINRAPR